MAVPILLVFLNGCNSEIGFFGSLLGGDNQQNSSTLELEDAAADQSDIITESTVTAAESVDSELQVN